MIHSQYFTTQRVKLVHLYWQVIKIKIKKYSKKMLTSTLFIIITNTLITSGFINQISNAYYHLLEH